MGRLFFTVASGVGSAIGLLLAQMILKAFGSGLTLGGMCAAYCLIQMWNAYDKYPLVRRGS